MLSFNEGTRLPFRENRNKSNLKVTKQVPAKMLSNKENGDPAAGEKQATPKKSKRGRILKVSVKENLIKTNADNHATKNRNVIAGREKQSITKSAVYDESENVENTEQNVQTNKRIGRIRRPIKKPIRLIENDKKENTLQKKEVESKVLKDQTVSNLGTGKVKIKEVSKTNQEQKKAKIPVSNKLEANESSELENTQNKCTTDKKLIVILNNSLGNSKAKQDKVVMNDGYLAVKRNGSESSIKILALSEHLNKSLLIEKEYSGNEDGYRDKSNNKSDVESAHGKTISFQEHEKHKNLVKSDKVSKCVHQANEHNETVEVTRKQVDSKSVSIRRRIIKKESSKAVEAKQNKLMENKNKQLVVELENIKLNKQPLLRERVQNSGYRTREGNGCDKNVLSSENLLQKHNENSSKVVNKNKLPIYKSFVESSEKSTNDIYDFDVIDDVKPSKETKNTVVNFNKKTDRIKKKYVRKKIKNSVVNLDGTGRNKTLQKPKAKNRPFSNETDKIVQQESSIIRLYQNGCSNSEDTTSTSENNESKEDASSFDNFKKPNVLSSKPKSFINPVANSTMIRLPSVKNVKFAKPKKSNWRQVFNLKSRQQRSNNSEKAELSDSSDDFDNATETEIISSCEPKGIVVLQNKIITKTPENDASIDNFFGFDQPAASVESSTPNRQSLPWRPQFSTKRNLYLQVKSSLIPHYDQKPIIDSSMVDNSKPLQHKFTAPKQRQTKISSYVTTDRYVEERPSLEYSLFNDIDLSPIKNRSKSSRITDDEDEDSLVPLRKDESDGKGPPDLNEEQDKDDEDAVGLFKDLPTTVSDSVVLSYANKKRKRMDSCEKEEIVQKEEGHVNKKHARNAMTKKEIKEFDAWAEEFNSMCDEVEQHHLEVETDTSVLELSNLQ